ncbi:hypothetical protein [Fibrobacter sp. UWB12]|uniref:hypothetical protein n=1 Tax=Fibrobacter sp. UWB12 TaxID=1896203 RepID=UPI0009148FEA|nr:hypothetical protein [Fibrobacter sp. UWB12]SHK68849.1 hypothetical protein SAMN05720759_105136 [Fibrobacter sp. UWB12]
MVKKLLSTSAVAALVFAACSTEDPVAPAPEYLTNSSSSIQGYQGGLYSSSDFYSSSSTVHVNDPNFMDENVVFSNNECYVTSNAADQSIVLNMTYAGEGYTRTSMTLLPGNKVEMESTVFYDGSISDAKVKQYCEEAKEEALAEGATVVCAKRSVTAKQTKPTNGETFEEVVKESQEMCDLWKMMFPESSSSAQILISGSSSSSLYIPPKTENGKATCEVVEDNESTFQMVIVDPDSVTMTMTATNTNGLFSLNAVAVFAPNVPQSTIDKECAEAKAEAAEEEDGEAVVTCNGNVITETESMFVGQNILNLIAPTLIAVCDKIQETGAIPEDDEVF